MGPQWPDNRGLLSLVATLLVWLSAIGPWVFTGGLALFLTKRTPLGGGARLVVFSAASMLGALWVSGLALMMMALGASLLVEVSIFLFAALGLVGLVLLITSLYFLHKSPPKTYSLRSMSSYTPSFALLVPLLVVLTVNGFLVTQVPAFGWDVLWSWAEISNDFIQANRVGNPEPWTLDSTHPSTVSIIAGISGWIGGSLAQAGPAFPAWYLVWLSLSLCVIGFTAHTTGGWFIPVLVGLIVSCVPLLQNHVVIGGYADLFIAGSVTSGVALISLGQREHSWRLMTFGCLISASCIFYKNTGVLYGLIPIMSLAIASLLAKLSRRAMAGLFFGFLAVVIIIVLLLSQSDLSFKFGNRMLEFDAGNLVGITENQLHSMFINQSYSTLSWLLVFPLFLVISNKGGLRVEELTIWLSCLGLLGFFCLSQLTEYGYLYARPGNDTGNSRLSLPLFTTLPLLIGILFRHMSPRELVAAYRPA